MKIKIKSNKQKLMKTKLEMKTKFKTKTKLKKNTENKFEKTYPGPKLPSKKLNALRIIILHY